MISNEDLIFYHNILEDINLNNESEFLDNLKALKKYFRDFFRLLTQTENQFFSSTYSRIVYSIDIYNIPKNIANRIFRCNYLINNITLKSDINELKSTLNFCLNVFYELILFFDKQKTISPNKATTIEVDYTSTPSISESKKKEEHFDFLSVIIENKGTGKNENIFISGLNEELGFVKIYFDKKWKLVWDLIWKSAKIFLFNLKAVIKSNEKVFFTTNNSNIVLEPDVLIDVTDLSNCFLSTGFSSIPYFLQRLMPTNLTPKMIYGNLLNSIFDEIIANKEISFEDAYSNAIKNKPLQIFALASINLNELKDIKKILKENFEILKDRINEIDGDLISVEPTFYSPIFGLQGRLDLLVEFSDDSSRKIIIELKSGKAPSINSTIKTSDGKFIETGLWQSHLAQTTCYNMLLDSTFPVRTGSSRILYISDLNNPFRNAPNIYQKKQEVSIGRNIIISKEKKILDGDFSFLDEILKGTHDNLPNFIFENINELKQIFNEASPLEIEYFKNFYRFILRESYSARIGSDNDYNHNGKSSIWQDSLNDKITSMDIIPNLELDITNSDFDRLYLTFLKPQDDIFISSIRKGDLAILYQTESDAYSSPVNYQIIKCTIKEINDTSVVVSIRNKLIRTDIFNNNHKWFIEPDHIDSTDKYLFHSLINFLSSEKDKKELLLGLKMPETNDLTYYNFNYLTPLQNEIVSKAISAKDYFIIQGPPGTGKTSYILKTIAEFYNYNSGMNILILAYTNRAVDEICSALTNIDNLKFLRLGTKENSSFSEKLISSLAEKMPLRDLFRIFNETRFIVSTVSSVLVNPEIFNMKSFQLAIVDEASQILEPQLIGILSKVEKFILIGDEKQLPAVVLHDIDQLKIENENLQKIHLLNFSQSLFERLLRCCFNNGWINSFGMLTEQARMHKNIQFIANTLFYNNSLTLFSSNGWQNESSVIHQVNTTNDYKTNKLHSLLLENRILFFDSDIEKYQKKHLQEAKRIRLILSALEKIYDDKIHNDLVGIITPFRAQCNEIFRMIDARIKHNITIDTVERFQGSERDVIIISFAVNHHRMIDQISSFSNINGLLIDRKLNVAITRAKKQLILLGASQVLIKSEVYRKLIGLIKENFCFIRSDECIWGEVSSDKFE